jgi:uncharacterized membrane protein required for colicin V production
VNWFDVAIIVVVIWFTFSAFQAGFVRETVTIVAALLGVVLAGYFYVDVAQNALSFIDNERLARIVAFGVIFGMTALGGQMIALVLKPTVNLFQLGIFDQLLGGAFGFGKAMVFIEAFMVVFITYPRWGLTETIDQSLFGSVLMKHTPVVVRLLPDEFAASVKHFPANAPASLPGSQYKYQPPGNVPPMLNP